ncbi:MAG TPA: FAD-dependent oxidoreductase [Egibacteraceae bacterium]|nr:FAD-dependent oxidoreductase [Egibacteraceae bacterium]
MTSAGSWPGRPSRVAVVGAGIVGLSTAWFLQERGTQVTVFDRRGVAAGASWGNAGWLTPGLAAPLADPALLGYGIRALLRPTSPVYVPVSIDLDLWRFLASFVRHATARRWRQGLRSLALLSSGAFDAFDALVAGGVDAVIRDSPPVLAAYRSASAPEALLEELSHIRVAGLAVDYDLLDAAAARAAEPALSGAISAVVRIRGQRFVDPGAFVHALAASVGARGGEVREGISVEHLAETSAAVIVGQSPQEASPFDAAVLCTGAWLPRLARRVGVRAVVQAGRGYSFSVAADPMPAGPIYFPEHRVTCTPLGDRMRIAGMMELRRPDAALDPRRVDAIAEAARPLLQGADVDSRTDEWVGSRPCTADGLPLIGPTRSRRIFVAGGHGMWGLTLGPVTGRLLAEAICSAAAPPQLAPFDPLR